MKIISVHYGHNATAALLKDGKIVFCQGEERLNKLKNSTGFPDLTLDLIKEKFGNDFDFAVIPNKTILSYAYLKNTGENSFRPEGDFSDSRKIDFNFLLRYLFFKYVPEIAYRMWSKKVLSYAERLEKNKNLREEYIGYLSKKIGIEKDKIIFLDHHDAHAYAAAFGVDQNRETLIFTADGEGDNWSSTVSLYKGGQFKILSRSRRLNSLGALYTEITGLLGMRQGEDEYKVMGLAPYAKNGSKQVERVYNKLSKLISLNSELEFESTVPAVGICRYYLFEHLTYERFDNVAAGLQKFLEDIVSKWVEGWVRKTGIKDIALGGGVFMNVKLNQKLAELKEIKSVFPVPSAGDESLPIGSLLYGYKVYCDRNREKFNPVILSDLYLGQEFGDDEIKHCVENDKYSNKFKIKIPKDMEEVIADLLAKNKIVARYNGRMEWGARALGNRSILANPSSRDNVRIINEMIKNRDFWMPFASSILEEDFSRYMINPKKIKASYMNITFNTTEEAKKDLIAGLHPYDFTCRPQIVSEPTNPSYYEIIFKFKKKTGIGGVLNTSFNLHGEPLVSSPEDALHVFLDSGLEYLAIGKYLLSK